MNKQRPKYLNLFQIRLPVTGVVSIMHRLSGVLLVLAIPFLLYVLQLSLSHPSGFAHARYLLNQPVTMALALIVALSLVHHFLAGMRFLLFDLDIGFSRQVSRTSAWLVLVIGLLLAAFILNQVLL
ncbi:MAG: succinate dehydrogenase, cytochrome b556 subunit [Gammaproteobacteria bacterium]|nr:succinate dehydrogenase, cytochrome b556 subunit [Gammaproteobacteria bacterium]